MPDKFRVDLGHVGLGIPDADDKRATWPSYFLNFYTHCSMIANEHNWQTGTVMNHELKPLGGKVISTKTQGWYLRWDNPASHSVFVLRWS
jgi:hypothetical protein